jgi:plastocyanin
MNKIITAIIVVIVIVAGAYYFSTRAPQTAYQDKGTTVQAPSGMTPTPVEQNLVTYTDNGYLPSTINVKVGTTVTFKNESSQSMWTASAMHPTHTVYPTTGGCIGSTFDACKGIQPGESWSFKFDIAGSWKYHNHLNPSHFGTVVVE